MEVIRPLGWGTNTTVDLVCLDNGSCGKTHMAVKSSHDPSTIRGLHREKEILDAFHGCPEIVQCLGDHWEDNEKDDGDGEYARAYSIYLEYVPSGDLFSNICRSRNGKLPVEKVKQYTRSILKGLAVVHEKGYVHCDVKPENILVASSDDKVKIADFGAAGKRGEAPNRGSLRGTLQYLAPESLEHGEYEPPVDVWALGCTVVEMLTGELARKLPRGISLDMKLDLMRSGKVVPEIPKKLSLEAKHFLRKCLVDDPAERWTAKMLLKHPFIYSDGSSSESDEANLSSNSSRHGSINSISDKVSSRMARCTARSRVKHWWAKVSKVFCFSRTKAN